MVEMAKAQRQLNSFPIHLLGRRDRELATMEACGEIIPRSFSYELLTIAVYRFTTMLI